MLSQEQLDDRLNYVTGSDAAVVCGLSPWKTKLELWMEKTKRTVAEDISGLNHIKFGNYFEDGVAKWFEAESGKTLKQESPGTIYHKDFDFMSGNVDRVLENENAILECKTAYNDTGWGNGQNIIPPYYLMQVAHYCAVGGYDRAYIDVVFASKREMRWYVYERNTSLEEKIIAREKDFWFNHVLADVPPEPETEKDILLLYKETSADPVVANQDIYQEVLDLQATSAKIKALESEKKRLRESVVKFMLANDTLISNDGKELATWRFTKPINRFDSKSLKDIHPDIYSKFTKECSPNRVFRVKN
tara:strand:+ start:7898 stop:8809 length:912 start_codon:yes stop_codon:yes gene_type:complete